RPVGRGAVGEPDRDGARRTGDGTLDAGADDVVAVDEPGTGEPGVVRLDDALVDGAALGLVLGGRGTGAGAHVDVVQVGCATGGRSRDPDRVGARVERGVDARPGP